MVVVRDGRIVEVRPVSAVAALGSNIDLRQGTCFPGLADLHAHIQLGPDVLAGSNLDRSSADRALYSLRNAQTMLRAGFTTLRDPGELDAHYSTIAVRNSIASGDFVGPRLLIAPHMVSPTGGHGDYNSPGA